MEIESSTATAAAGMATTATVMNGHECPERCQEDVELCSFCQSRPAVVRVPLPSLKKRHKRIPTAFCLLHYYTTSAVRVNSRSSSALGSAAAAAAAGAASELKPASRPASTDSAAAVATPVMINHKALEEQLPAQQELFAEAFVQLRQELQEIAMQQFTAHGHDPLSILHDLHHRHHPSSSTMRTTTAAATATSKKHSWRKDPPMKQQQKRNKIMDQSGGFLLKPAPMPKRLEKLQQSTMTTAAQQQPRRPDPTQRRKSSRKSVWNVLLEDEDKVGRNTTTAKTNKSNTTINVDWTMGLDKVCTCGSTHVQTIASNTSHRNQDMAKAETWGNKDRGGDIITRYQCHTCAKMWNEEE